MRLGNQSIPLYSGALHYFHLSPARWRDALYALKALGLPMVETYVPWDVHELGPGRFDFGADRPELDLGAFLDLAHALELKVFLRPGPHINGELTRFGLPARVVHDPLCQARSPQQRPVYNGFPPQMFPVPSFASDTFQAETARWFEAVAEVVRPRIWPRGPVVLLQVDNEGALYFRNGPFDQDYRPEALALYRRELARIYGDPATLAEVYDAPLSSFDEVMPPTRFDAKHLQALPRQLDWQRAHECLVTEGISMMARALRKAGLAALPTVHNLPLAELSMPLHVPELAQRLDVVGLDYYHRATEFETIKRRTLYAAGTLPFAYAPEVGVGGPPWFTALSADDSLFCAMTATAFGLRGFNLYMAVDRDRWYGSPIDHNGRQRESANAWRRLFDALTHLEIPRLTREVRVGIVVPQLYRRLARATHLLGGMVSPAALEIAQAHPVDGCRDDGFGQGGPVQILFWEALLQFGAALTEAQIPYVLIDSDTALAQFQSLDVIFAPIYEFSDTGMWSRLAERAQDGAQIFFGPRIPAFDAWMRPASFEPKQGMSLVDPTDGEGLRALIEERLATFQCPYRSNSDGIEVTVHRDAHRDRVLFVINKREAQVDAQIFVPHPLRVRDALSDERFEANDVLRVTIPGRTCRIFELEHARNGEASS